MFDDELLSFSGDEFMMPSFEQLREEGFTEADANNILDESRVHCYSYDELYDALQSNDPVSAYHNLLDQHAQIAIDKADQLIKELENNKEYNLSFGGGFSNESRSNAASALETELGYKGIHIIGSYGFDADHGGFDRITGNKIHDAIEKARGEERISDYTYRQLMRELDNACYYQ